MEEVLKARKRNVNGSNPPRRGGGKRKNRDARRTERNIDAELRQEARDARTDEEQIALILDRGHDKNCKEILRLQKKIAKAAKAEKDKDVVLSVDEN